MYNIGKFADITGLTKRALRFYESKGLLKPQKDKINNYRTYCESDFQKALKIEFYKSLGFSLDEIGEILNLTENNISIIEGKLKNILNKLENEETKLNNQKNIINKVLDILNKSQKITFEQIKISKELTIKERRNVMQKLNFISTHGSLIGKREENQDYSIKSETDKGNLYLIADGFGGNNLSTVINPVTPGFERVLFGGNNNGCMASHIACETIRENMNFDKITDESFEQYILELIELANVNILAKYADNHGKMGTTISILIIKNDKAYIGHVGDSRIYRLRDNKLEQLTEDHTIIQKLLNEGKILRKDINTHPDKNILYSCIGYTDKVKEVFTRKIEVKKNDIFLLLTDGVYNILSDSEILQQFNDKNNIKNTEQNIFELLKLHGEDNASFQLVYPE